MLLGEEEWVEEGKAQTTIKLISMASSRVSSVPSQPARGGHILVGETEAHSDLSRYNRQ